MRLLLLAAIVLVSFASEVTNDATNYGKFGKGKIRPHKSGYEKKNFSLSKTKSMKGYSCAQFGFKKGEKVAPKGSLLSMFGLDTTTASVCEKLTICNISKDDLAALKKDFDAKKTNTYDTILGWVLGHGYNLFSLNSKKNKNNYVEEIWFEPETSHPGHKAMLDAEMQKLHDEYAEREEKQKKQRRRKVAALKKSHQKAHDETKEELEAAHKKKQELEDAHKSNIHELHTQKKAEIEKLKKSHEKKAKKQQAHADSVAEQLEKERKIREEKENKLQEMKKQVDEFQAQLLQKEGENREIENKIKAQRAESEKERKKLLKNLKKKEKQQAQKNKEMEKKLAEVEKEAERKLKENISKREQMHQKSVNELRNYFENKSQEDAEELEKSKQEELENLRKRFEKKNKGDIQKLEKSFETKNRDDLKELTHQLRQNHEKEKRDLQKKHREVLIQKLQKLEANKKKEKDSFEEAYRWALNSEAILKRSIIFELIYKHNPDTLDIVNNMLEEELNDLIRAQSMKTMLDTKKKINLMHQNFICPPPSQRLFPNFDENAYNVIVVGKSGVGKSTFIQNLHDSIEKFDIASTIETDVVECTKKPNRYELPDYGITLWDIPGYGTSNIELGDYGFLYIQKFGLLWFDKIIILTSERVHAFESTIPMQLVPNNIVSAVARSKVNVDIRDRKTMLWKEQVRQKVPRRQRKVWNEQHERKFLEDLKKDLTKSAPGANEYFLIGHYDAFDEAEVEFDDAVEFVLKKEKKLRKNSINIFSYPQNWDLYVGMSSNGTSSNDIRRKMRHDGLNGKRIEECMKNLNLIVESNNFATAEKKEEAVCNTPAEPAPSNGDDENKDLGVEECQPGNEQCIKPNNNAQNGRSAGRATRRGRRGNQ